MQGGGPGAGLPYILYFPTVQPLSGVLQHPLLLLLPGLRQVDSCGDQTRTASVIAGPCQQGGTLSSDSKHPKIATDRQRFSHQVGLASEVLFIDENLGV